MELSSANFTEQLHYNQYKNGNISFVHYEGPCYDYCYDFTYDTLDRLVYCNYYNRREPEEKWADPDFSEYVAYDSNGNVIGLRRTGFPDEGEESTFIDDLVMCYDGNQLRGVKDKENDPTNLTTKNFIQNGDGESDYSYNANGALQTDANKGIVFIEYDVYGYPRAVYFDRGYIIKYVHAPDGRKLQESYVTGVSYMLNPYGKPFTLTSSQIHSVITKDYWGSDVISNNGSPTMFFFDGGFSKIDGQSQSWYYYVCDHLGSKRIVQDEQGKVDMTYNYYPYGTIFDHWAEIYSHGIGSPFSFNSKELCAMYGLYGYDFGARLYDSLLGRWFSVDPLCEKYYSWSPYAFCADNPINIIDPDGRKLVLGGSYEERMEILTYLQMLTNDNLLMNRKTGDVFLSGKPRWSNRNKKLSVGTSLVRDIISNKHTLSIRVGNDCNEEYAVPSHDGKTKGRCSDAVVNFNPTRRTPLGVAGKNGNAMHANNLPHLALGHELVHGVRDMKGHAASLFRVSYTYKGWNGNYIERSDPEEELITTGIMGNYKYTDNKIRKEQGYSIRVRY